MHKLVEDAIDDLMSHSYSEDEAEAMCCPCEDSKEEVEEKRIRGLQVEFSVHPLDFTLPDLDVMESRFEDEQYVKDLKMVIRRKALERLETLNSDDMPIVIRRTEPYICALLG